jgi:hypothetical protein
MRKPCKNCGSRRVGIASAWEKSIMVANAVAACRKCGTHTAVHRVPAGVWADEPMGADEFKSVRRRAVLEAFQLASAAWNSGEVFDA